jgi:hypothetical protein
VVAQIKQAVTHKKQDAHVPPPPPIIMHIHARANSLIEQQRRTSVYRAGMRMIASAHSFNRYCNRTVFFAALARSSACATAARRAVQQRSGERARAPRRRRQVGAP